MFRHVGTSLLIHTATEQSSASYYGEQGLHYVDVKGESCLVPRGMFSSLCCHSFLSCDYNLARLHSAALPVMQCLGVSLSVTFVYCVETAKDMAVVAVECE